MENNTYEYSYDQNPAKSQYQYQQSQQYNSNEEPMTLGAWVATLLLGSIPCVGLILYIVWACGKNVNVNKKNFCRAALIIAIVIGVLYGILGAVLGATLADTMSSMYY